jgi:uncharacterized protein YhhL (DUF1145 family)
MKAAMGAIWVLLLASFFVPFGGLEASMEMFFWVLLGIHVVEVAVFMGRLKAAGGSLGNHMLQVLLFGVVHLRTLRLR